MPSVGVACSERSSSGSSAAVSSSASSARSSAGGAGAEHPDPLAQPRRRSRWSASTPTSALIRLSSISSQASSSRWSRESSAEQALAEARSASGDSRARSRTSRPAVGSGVSSTGCSAPALRHRSARRRCGAGARLPPSAAVAGRAPGVDHRARRRRRRRLPAAQPGHDAGPTAPSTRTPSRIRASDDVLHPEILTDARGARPPCAGHVAAPGRQVAAAGPRVVQDGTHRRPPGGRRVPDAASPPADRPGAAPGRRRPGDHLGGDQRARPLVRVRAGDGGAGAAHDLHRVRAPLRARGGRRAAARRGRRPYEVLARRRAGLAASRTRRTRPA